MAAYDRSTTVPSVPDLLTRKLQPAARNVINVSTKSLQPQPSAATHHAATLYEPSPTLAEGFTGRTILRKGAEGMFVCVERDPARSA